MENQIIEIFLSILPFIGILLFFSRKFVEFIENISGTQLLRKKLMEKKIEKNKWINFKYEFTKKYFLAIGSTFTILFGISIYIAYILNIRFYNVIFGISLLITVSFVGYVFNNLEYWYYMGI